MGEADRYLRYRNKRMSLGADGNALMMLISINAVLFITLTFIQVLYLIVQAQPTAFETNILPWFTMPAKVSELAYKPWTLISQMFTHMSVIMAISNMLWLWAFGSILQSVAGNRKVIPVYLYGGVAGAIAFIAANYLIPSLRIGVNHTFLFGANAAVMAVAVATTALAPDYRFFRMLNGGIPIWILTLVYVLIDFTGVANGNAAYSIAHLAGGLTGFLFIFSFRRGADWSIWMNKFYDWLINLFNPNKKPVSVQRKIKERVFYNTGNQKPFVKRTHITQQRIDEILDKINQQGYNFLTEEEKNILKKAAETDL